MPRQRDGRARGPPVTPYFGRFPEMPLDIKYMIIYFIINNLMMTICERPRKRRAVEAGGPTGDLAPHNHARPRADRSRTVIFGTPLSADLRCVDGTMSCREDLTPLQYAAFPFLREDPGLDQIGLAARIGVDRTNVGLLIDYLEARGFVERRIDSNDRRSRRLYLTSRRHQIS